MSDTDRNYPPSDFADKTDLLIGGKEWLPSDAREYDDILKLSNCDNFQIVSVHVAQGHENSVDMNRDCVNGVLDGHFGVGYDGSYKIQCAIVIKGGARNITVRGVIHSRGKHYDVELGGWSDQVKRASVGIDLRGLKHADGKPVRVAIANAKHVRLGPHCKKAKLWSLLLKAFNLWRRFTLIFS